MIKVRCPADRLTDNAEVLRLKLKARDGKFVSSFAVPFLCRMVEFETYTNSLSHCRILRAIS